VGGLWIVVAPIWPAGAESPGVPFFALAMLPGMVGVPAFAAALLAMLLWAIGRHRHIWRTRAPLNMALFLACAAATAGPEAKAFPLYALLAAACLGPLIWIRFCGKVADPA